MSLLLNIDTALEIASICLSNNSKVLQYAENATQKDHSGWLHKAIQQVLKNENLSINDLAAVAVTIGPGSYTGLRVGLSAAKGICYALNIPLLTINNLYLFASIVENSDADLICACIDARRMEVYTAIYNRNLEEVLPPQALILNEKSFSEQLNGRKVCFCGNSNVKINSVVLLDNAVFFDAIPNAKSMVGIATQLLIDKAMTNLSTIEPLYVKPFYSANNK